MKSLLPILPLVLLTTSAPAALVLTVDASAKTVTWSGSFTTAGIAGGFDFPDFYLANTLTNNPNPSPLQVIANSAGSLSSVPSGFSGEPNTFQTSSGGEINITENISLISAYIANVFDFDTETYTFTTTGNDAAISYSGINAASQTFLESLDSTTLDLIRRGDNAPANTIVGIAGGGPAATIVVVPEPSTIFLGALGALTLLRRRR